MTKLCSFVVSGSLESYATLWIRCLQPIKLPCAVVHSMPRSALIKPKLDFDIRRPLMKAWSANAGTKFFALGQLKSSLSSHLQNNWDVFYAYLDLNELANKKAYDNSAATFNFIIELSFISTFKLIPLLPLFSPCSTFYDHRRSLDRFSSFRNSVEGVGHRSVDSNSAKDVNRGEQLMTVRSKETR